MRATDFLIEDTRLIAFTPDEIRGMKFRKPSTPSFKNWFGYGRVPKVVFHATSSNFSEFDTSKSDLGAHFGTLEQAEYVVANRNKRAKIIPCFINIRNPLRLKDVGTFHADGIADQLERKGLLLTGEGIRIVKEIDADWKLRGKYNPLMRKVIIDAGYDGVVYKNTHEGTGDSYIIFSPNQVKFALATEVSDSADFLKEDTLQQQAARSLPGAYVIPELQNQDPYRQYRFSVALAGAKSQAHRDEEAAFKTAPETPWGENMIVIGYGYDIGPDIDAALKQIGKSGKRQVSTISSDEPADTFKTSTVPTR